MRFFEYPSNHGPVAHALRPGVASETGWNGLRWVSLCQAVASPMEIAPLLTRRQVDRAGMRLCGNCTRSGLKLARELVEGLS